VTAPHASGHPEAQRPAGSHPPKTMNLTLQVWRQAGPNSGGGLEEYKATGVSPEMSFLEMLDVVNEELIGRGEVPIAFDHDCREGICGSCGMMINGVAHGPSVGTATCQLHMRSFKDGDTVVIEPWRSRAFPIVKDLVVNRSALDRIVAAGGFISAPTGSAQDGNALPVPKQDADAAMDAAACIQCGACVAACPNGSASLFTGAKISHLGLLPQGQPERYRRALKMVAQMDIESFGGCSFFGECQEACPKEISIDVISRMNRDFLTAAVTQVEERSAGGDA
jgi:succinate dehydrogenase / fumarate reductase, iron-sulfur subunit